MTCGDQCTDLEKDPQNCGTCGTACATGETCDRGSCVTACLVSEYDGFCFQQGNFPDGGAACASGGGSLDCEVCPGAGFSSCADLLVDSRNCGACGNTCAAGYACIDGSCVAHCADPADVCADVGQVSGIVGTNIQTGACLSACPNGQDVCSSTVSDGGVPLCTDLLTNTSACGACGATCYGGSCIDGGCMPACASRSSSSCGTCPDGYGCTSGSCVPLCGGTDVCVSCTNSKGSCGSSGSCQTACAAGQDYCPPSFGGSGLCTDLSRDSRNCGACGNRCPSGENCAGGQCGPDCPIFAATSVPVCAGPSCTPCKTSFDDGGFSCCSGEVPCNGDCVKLNSNSNCGTCGNACPYGSFCSDGGCQLDCLGGLACADDACVANCPAGQAPCPTDAGVPVCRDLLTSSTNCGTCGNACPTGTRCIEGRCDPTCDGGTFSAAP